MLQYASEASTILMKYSEKDNFKDSNDLRAKLFYLVSGIFEVNLFSDRKATFADETSSWSSFPLPSSWQSASQRKISKQTYNLCIGCSVSTFSGWEIEEFTMDRMLKDRRKIRRYGHEGQAFFGIRKYLVYQVSFSNIYLCICIECQV